MKKIWIAMAAPLMFLGSAAWAGGDVEAGKAAYESTGCGDCHYEDDFAGMPEDEIKALIEGTVTGDIEHDPELSGLTDEQVADMAAFFASFE